MRDSGHDNKTPHTENSDTTRLSIASHYNVYEPLIPQEERETEQRAEVVRQCDTTFITIGNRQKKFSSEGSQAVPARPFIKGKLVKVKAKWSLYTP